MAGDEGEKASFVVFLILLATPPVRGLAPTLAPVPSSHYRGGMLGVHADVSVCRNTKSATIVLTGLPIGGRCVGKAHMDEAGRVTVLDPLASKLARRGVVIDAVDVGIAERQLWVRMMLPFGLGRVTMPLNRVGGVESCVKACA